MEREPFGPLSVGEIFDKALTVYVKNWRPFSVLALVVALPVGFLRFYQASVLATNAGSTASGASTAGSLAALWKMYSDGAQHENQWIVWSILVGSYVAAVLVDPVFIIGLIGCTSGGQSTELRQWLVPVIRRAGRLSGLLGIWILACVVLFVGVALLLSIPIVVLAVATHTPSLGVIVVITLTALVIVPLFFTLDIAFNWSLYVAVVEESGAFPSFRAAIARSLCRRRFWRTVGIGAALTALSLVVAGALTAAVAGLFFWTKSAILIAAVGTLVTVPVLAFGRLVMSVYYLDTRGRNSAASIVQIAH